MGITEEMSAVLRKSKLLNQFGAVCMQASNFEKAGNLFEQAIQMFEKFKSLAEALKPPPAQAKNFNIIKKASFSNVWYNQAN